MAGKGPAVGKGKGKPKKVKTSGAPNAYPGGTGIVRETTTKKPSKGRSSRR